MDLDQLALETLNLKTTFRGKNPFDIHRFDKLPEPLEEFWSDDEVEPTPLRSEVDSLQEWLYPEGPGLLFVFARTGPTFCLRGIVAKCIKDEYEKIKSDYLLLSDYFRLEADEENIDHVRFHETGSVELAEVIRDQFFNRRFPIEEDVLCNLSDPGFSWWLRKGTMACDLYFRSHGVNRAQELVGLGPMGDRGIASLRFRSLLEQLSMLGSITELNCTEKQVGFKIAPVSLDLMKEWTDFLEFGILPQNFLRHLEELKDKTLYYYTQELAALRVFWIEIEHELKNTP